MNATIDLRNKTATSAGMRACNCIGPQNGEPACPCAMRSVRVVDGRYVRITDLGPAPTDHVALKLGDFEMPDPTKVQAAREWLEKRRIGELVDQSRDTIRERANERERGASHD